MTMTNDQIAALALELVDAATRKNLTLRVLAGVAVYLTCPTIATHPTLKRTWLDLDFVALRRDWDGLAEVFGAHGLTMRKKGSAHWLFEKEGFKIELCDPVFTYADLSTRLMLPAPTLPLTDLLLHKLQRAQFEERDIQDSIALLLDHHVERGEAEGQIDCEYIARVCARKWRLFHTVYDNTVTLERVLDKYVEPREAQLVWRRIELIQADMDQQSKSPMWMLNQILRKPSRVLA